MQRSINSNDLFIYIQQFIKDTQILLNPDIEYDGSTLCAMIQSIQENEKIVGNMLDTYLSSADFINDTKATCHTIETIYKPTLHSLDVLHREAVLIYLELPKEEKQNFMEKYLPSKENIFLYDAFMNKIFTNPDDETTLLACLSDTLKILSTECGYKNVKILNELLQGQLNSTNVYLFKTLPDDTVLKSLFNHYILTEKGELFFVHDNIIKIEDNAEKLLDCVRKYGLDFNANPPLGENYNCLSNSRYFLENMNKNTNTALPFIVEINDIISFGIINEHNLKEKYPSLKDLNIVRYNILLSPSPSLSLSYLASRARFSPTKEKFITPTILNGFSKSHITEYLNYLKKMINSLSAEDFKNPITINPFLPLQLLFPKQETEKANQLIIKIGQAKNGKVCYIYSPRYTSLHHEFIHMTRMLTNVSLSFASTSDILEVIYKNLEEFAAIQSENEIRNVLGLVNRLTHHGFGIESDLIKVKENAVNYYLYGLIEIGTVNLNVEQLNKISLEEKIEIITASSNSTDIAINTKSLKRKVEDPKDLKNDVSVRRNKHSFLFDDISIIPDSPSENSNNQPQQISNSKMN